MIAQTRSPLPDPERGEVPVAQSTVLLDQMPGAVLLLDAGGRVTFANGAAELRLDSVRSELLGRDLFREVLPELEAQGQGERYRAAMADGSVSLACEVATPWHDERGRAGLGIRSFVRGGLLGAIVLIEDRTALAVEESRRRRAERLAAVGELAGGVAHEINNPLASIKGFAQLLAREAETESQVQGLEIISRESSRIARVIDTLLEFQSQQRARGREPLDLSALVDYILDLRRYGLETSGIEIERQLDAELSPVFGERSGLQRVVLALLAQAEHSLSEREDGRRLTVRTREATDGVVLQVTDNGAGVKRERLPSLFSPGAEEEEWGGGIDLASAGAIVREHGGHLSAESVEGQGTTFLVRLPRWEESGRVATQAPRVRGMPEHSLRVLVADDEPALRLAIALFLTRHGHEVVEAPDAYTALRLATEERFDVVLADARMPGAGAALLEKLETTPELHGRTILIDGDGAGSAAAAGRPHLTKPFDMTDVLRLVEAVGG
jgi:nitrogen-specific signal transduction histidine kinase/CheY-like chemotaxis protein